MYHHSWLCGGGGGVGWGWGEDGEVLAEARSQKRVSHPLKLELQEVVSHSTWVLGKELLCRNRRHWEISPVPYTLPFLCAFQSSNSGLHAFEASTVLTKLPPQGPRFCFRLLEKNGTPQTCLHTGIAGGSVVNPQASVNHPETPD